MKIKFFLFSGFVFLLCGIWYASTTSAPVFAVAPTYKGSLLGQLRWQCAAECMHGGKDIKGYAAIKKCTEKCIKLPPRGVSNIASENQKTCKRGIFKEFIGIDKQTCTNISMGRDLVELMINKWNGTKDGCPLGAKLKGIKCMCSEVTKLNKDHTQCVVDGAKKDIKNINENVEFIKELIQPINQQKQPIIQPTQAKSPSSSEKKFEGTTIQFTFDPLSDETKYMACSADAQCPGDYACKEHYYTLKRVCSKRPEGKACASNPEDAAKDGRLFVCQAGDECVYGTCVRLALYDSSQRSVGAWKCDGSGTADAQCQKEFGVGYFCRDFGSYGKLCARAQAPYSGLCLQQGCTDKSDSCIMMTKNTPACVRTAP